MVHGSESYVCDIIDVFEAMENVFPDPFGSDPFLIRCPFVFEFIDHLFDLVMIHTSFIERHEDAPLYLGAVVEVFFSVRFRYKEVDELQSLKSRESCSALFALPSATDGLTVFSHTGIDNVGIEVFTFRTAHDLMKNEELRIKKKCMSFFVFVKF